jgi:hypothetical protein
MQQKFGTDTAPSTSPFDVVGEADFSMKFLRDWFWNAGPQ